MILDYELLGQFITSEDEDLNTLSEKRPVLLVFLRHFGCTFCREALSDLSVIQGEISRRRAKLVCVHMEDMDMGDKYLRRYNLEGTAHISDPDLILYQYFGLKHGTPSQLFGISTWARGFKAGIIDGNGLGWLKSDSTQMPGVFLVYKGEIRESYIHRKVSDRPDYLKIVDACNF